MKAGWKLTTLGDSFTTATGNTPPKNNADLFGSFMPLIKPPELCDAELDTSEDGLSEFGVPFARTVPPNSILVSCIGNLGKIGLNTVPVAFNQQINAILPDERKALSRFMFFQVLSCTFKDQLESMASGTTVPIVNKSKFNSIQIVLPPLSEQKRIVTLLDEAFAHIATAKANSEQNLQNARALFDSHLQSALTHGGSGWKSTTLGAAIDLLLGFAFKSDQYTESADSISLLRGDNIMQGVIRWDDVKKWRLNNLKPYEKYQLGEGDIVLAMDRPWVKAGLKRAMICADDLPCLLVQRTACLRAGKNMNTSFLLHLVSSSAFTQHILGVQTGSGVPHISGQQIKDFRFHCPPILMQSELAAQLDALSKETQRLESIYQQKLSALGALKKSLLHQAFSGQL